MKQGVRGGVWRARKLRRPRGDLLAQVFPLIVQLAGCDRDLWHASGTLHPNFRGIEVLAPRRRLGLYASEKTADRSHRIRLLPKPRQLRVIAVAHRLACQHLLGEQRFPPAGNKPLAVEVAGVEGPYTHTPTLPVGLTALPGKFLQFLRRPREPDAFLLDAQAGTLGPLAEQGECRLFVCV